MPSPAVSLCALDEALGVTPDQIDSLSRAIRDGTGVPLQRGLAAANLAASAQGTATPVAGIRP